MDRRRVDWSTLLKHDAPAPKASPGSLSSNLASMLSAFDAMFVHDEVDTILRCAIELARERIGLQRVGIFLRDESRGLMLGTWGTDLEGATVEERSIMYDMTPRDGPAYGHTAYEGPPWTVVENAPIVVHSATATRVVGRGWVCCTPLRSALGPVGMMFNDAGLSGAPVDETKQAACVVFSSVLGMALDVARRRPGRSSSTLRLSDNAPLVVKAVKLLANDPDMTCEELGAELRLSGSRVARVFKSEMGMSLVEYRNRLRIDRFMTLIDRGDYNLLEAALAAGFGSYAQFHRVFLALRGTTPRRHLRERAAASSQR